MSDPTTLQELLERLAPHGTRPAVLALQREGAESWDYARLQHQGRLLAHGLAQHGIGPGHQVALLAENRPEWIAACLAVLRSGATVVPLDVQLGAKSLRHVIADSAASLVFTTTRQIERLGRILPETQFVLLDGPADDPRNWRHWQQQAPDRPLPAVAPGSIATIFYTSGTTGVPKGVPLTHANLCFQIKTLISTRFVLPEDHLALPLPLHHVYPFVVGMLMPVALGARIIMPHALTGPEIVRALRDGQATVVLGVPRLYRALVASIESRVAGSGLVARSLFGLLFGTSRFLRRRLGLRAGKLLLGSLHRKLGPNVRIMASGGAALDPVLAWKLEALGWRVSIGYGLTETAPLLTLTSPGQGHLDSVGQPVPGVELKLRDGEVLARGPNVFGGYRNLPEETGHAFHEGWFRTGDLGYFDSQGYLHLTGRANTLIVTAGGKNIQPDELEAAYEEHPVIREIGVLQHQEQLVALVVPKLSEINAATDAQAVQAVRDAVKERSKQLPSYQRVVELAVTREPLPRTRLGKIQRHNLLERYLAARNQPDTAATRHGPVPITEMTEEDRALLEDPAAHKVWDWLAERYADKPLSPATSPQLDLGIDSMEWLNLTLGIGQRTGVELTEEAIGRIDTVRDLLVEVAKAAEQPAGTHLADPLAAPEKVLTEDQKRWLSPLNAIQRVLAGFLFSLNRVLMRLLFRVRLEGQLRLPAGGQFVITPNHVSFLDPFAVAALLTNDQLRNTYWAGWTGAAFRNLFFRFVSRLGQAVPIGPDRSVTTNLAFCAAVLQKGRNLVWFPEGSRSPSGQLMPFKGGIGRLLGHYAVPAVPVVIRGAYEALPVGAAWPRFVQITVQFGPPIAPAILKEQGQGPTAQDRIAAALQERVAALQQTAPPSV